MRCDIYALIFFFILPALIRFDLGLQILLPGGSWKTRTDAAISCNPAVATRSEQRAEDDPVREHTRPPTSLSSHRFRPVVSGFYCISMANDVASHRVLHRRPAVAASRGRPGSGAYTNAYISIVSSFPSRRLRLLPHLHGQRRRQSPRSTSSSRRRREPRTTRFRSVHERLHLHRLIVSVPSSPSSTTSPWPTTSPGSTDASTLLWFSFAVLYSFLPSLSLCPLYVCLSVCGPLCLLPSLLCCTLQLLAFSLSLSLSSIGRSVCLSVCLWASLSPSLSLLLYFTASCLLSLSLSVLYRSVCLSVCGPLCLLPSVFCNSLPLLSLSLVNAVAGYRVVLRRPARRIASLCFCPL